MVAVVHLLSKRSDYIVEKVAKDNMDVGELEQLSEDVLYVIVAPK